MPKLPILPRDFFEHASSHLFWGQLVFKVYLRSEIIVSRIWRLVVVQETTANRILLLEYRFKSIQFFTYIVDQVHVLVIKVEIHMLGCYMHHNQLFCWTKFCFIYSGIMHVLFTLEFNVLNFGVCYLFIFEECNMCSTFFMLHAHLAKERKYTLFMQRRGLGKKRPSTITKKRNIIYIFQEW